MMQTAANLDFRYPTVEDAAWAAPLLRTAGRMGCEYSFTTMFMWRSLYHNRLARWGDTLFISAGEESPVYLPPIGPSLADGVRVLLERSAGQERPLTLVGADATVVERLEDAFPGRFTFTSQRGDFDYIYRTRDLAELPGSAYHAKRNHIAGFSRKFNWTFEPIDGRNTAEVEAMAQEWCRQKGNCKDKGLRTENCAIREVLRHREALSVRGGLIRADGRVAAFTFGSPINDKVFDIQVEKALPSFPGAYAVINQAFASTLTAYPFLNRENDLDIEGLRKAKLSYHPAMVLEKYTCTQVR